MRQARFSRRRPPRPVKASAPEAALQRLADDSPAVQHIAALQAAADPVQREVDETPITPNGSFDARGNLAQDRSVGVPDWAADHYRDVNQGPDGVDATSITAGGSYDARGNAAADHSGDLALWAVHDFLMEETTMMASMTDGKIGSVYFPGGRVRTTHAAGPEVDEHAQSRTLQFNIDPVACWQAFVAVSPWLAQVNANNPQHVQVVEQRFLDFKILTLKNAAPNQPPAWATQIKVPGDALPANTDTTGGTNVKLFEIMLDEHGDVDSIHPSRGAAVQVRLTRSDLVKLRKAAEMVEDVPDPFLRNSMFHNYVVKNLPHLKDLIRSPTEVDYG